MPRLSVTSLTLCMPGTLRTWFSFSLPLRYSAIGDLGAEPGDVGEAAERLVFADRR